MILKFNKMPVRNKITLMYASVFSIVLMLSSSFILLNAWYFYKDVSKQELEETVSKVENYIKSDGEINEEAISNLNPNKYVEIRVINLNNFHKFEVMTEPGNFPPPDSEERYRNNKGDDSKKKVEFEMIKGTRYMQYDKFIEYSGEKYHIQVFRPYYREQKMMRIFALVFIIVNILGIFIAYCIGKFIGKKLLKPVVEISKAAESISINDLSQRINVPIADDEMRTLTLTFNDMIKRLEISFNKQKQFISDASHELRTPISVIQGYANLMDRWGKSDESILQESIDAIKDETEHMTTLIKKLLFLAKEEQNKSIQKKILNLNDVAEEVAKEVKVMDIKSEIKLNLNKNTYILGDYDLIKQMFWIFVENSVKYSDKENREISISTYNKDGRNFVSISDNGIGISEENLPFIFDRFYRSDKSRSKEIPGNGLGLSIAQLIINQHDGKVEVKSTLNKGTNFIVDFPEYKEERQ